MALNKGLRPHRGEVRLDGDLLVPFQLRTIRISTQVTLVALLASASFFSFSGEHQVKVGPYFALFVSVTIAAAMVTLLPWKRLFHSGLGAGTQYAWTAVNILLITLGIWVAGEGGSFFFLLYALPTVFSAVSFRPRIQVAFLVLTFSCYSAVMGFMGWDLMSLGLLGILAFLANFLSRELKRQMAMHSEARRESERRWDLVAAVAAAARYMSTADSRGVLETVVDSVLALGFDSPCIYVHDGADDLFQSIRPQVQPPELPMSSAFLPPVVRAALAEGRPVVVRPDPPSGSAEDSLDDGMSAAVAIPLHVGDRPEAVLFVGSHDPAGPSPQDVEVFRMLAAQASLALENARRFEEQSRDMERIAELDRLKGDFLSNVSHELRTPLTVITGMGLTLEQQWSAMGEDLRSEFLSRLNANAASLNDIITKLLDFSRVEAGRLDVQTSEVHLQDLLEEVADRLNVLFAEHVLEVRVQEGLAVEADPVLLERIVENLLSNAAKHTPAGSRIRLLARSEGSEAVVDVIDDGPGIPAHELKHLGERFFRGGDTNTRNTRGTGLGLALVQEILALHSGRLEVESFVGVGSQFTFRIPLAQRASHEGRVPTSMVHSEPRARSADGMFGGERFETVLTAARMGAEWAVAALHRALNPKIEGYIRAQAPGAAETLAGEVWMEIGSGLAEFDGDEASFRRWVFSAARRRLLDLRRRNGHEPHSEAPGVIGDGPAMEALARIAALPPDEAEVVLLRVVGDLTADEVAAVTGKRPGVVRLLQLQGIDRLTQELEDSLVDWTGGRAHAG